MITKKDPDALRNQIGDNQHAKLISHYGKELSRIMKKTGDHETVRFPKALKKIQ
jgi:hypothetical protein